ncbi:MAG: hypothetical protein ACRBBO_00545 [Cognatishimia sp.]|uniref:hypothetical protein n=1 Tax=Cognatishimia sp. 1_MG-2023 TaxID=3062642 RepID=UPI0026E1326A|nr:hypothetical protein [Cognatishimia sp. 1_MG-2023]MDO6726489.1 hypothetical protein [Cognatishimia sp. 1_MG-2023]
MNTRRSLVFLERQTYRRRRLIDWIRFLPIIGLMLWMVPLLWPIEGDKQVSSANAIIYIFAIWFALVFLKALSAQALRHTADQTDHAAGGDPKQETS